MFCHRCIVVITTKMGYREYRRVILDGSIPKEHIERMRRMAVWSSAEWRANPIFNLFIAMKYEDTEWMEEKVSHSCGVGKVYEGEAGVEEIKEELEKIVKEFPGTVFQTTVSDEDQEEFPYSFIVK